MLTYQNYIRNCIKNKYSESTIVNQKFFILFKESRINFLKNCFKKLNKIQKKKLPNDDYIFKFLQTCFWPMNSARKRGRKLLSVKLPSLSSAKGLLLIILSFWFMNNSPFQIALRILGCRELPKT